MKRVKNRRFSIIIPAYNEASYIEKTLQSIADQDYLGPIEVIVVDNNSDDNTAQIAKTHGAKLVQEKNPGVCWARQAGCKVATGDIVVSTDADTTFSSNWITTINNEFNRDGSAVAVAGPCHYVDAPFWGDIYPHLLFGLVKKINQLTNKTFYVTATNLAFKRSAWDGYDTSLTQGGDELDLLRNLQKQGSVAFLNNNPTYTSARRLKRGLIYNLFVSFLLYYIVAYYLNRIFGRPILGTAPKFRNEDGQHMTWVRVTSVSVLLLFAMMYMQHTGHISGHALLENFRSAVDVF